MKNLKNATEAALFLELRHRTEFFPIKNKYDLKPATRFGNMWLYSLVDLKKIKKLVKEKKLGNH